MPHIITTIPPNKCEGHLSRYGPSSEPEFCDGSCMPPGVVTRAATTLEKARHTAAMVVLQMELRDVGKVGIGNQWHDMEDDCYDLLSPGGKIGPLPDGTVIEVAETDYDSLASYCDMDPAHPVWDVDSNLTPEQEQQIIDAYNQAKS